MLLFAIVNFMKLSSLLDVGKGALQATQVWVELLAHGYRAGPGISPERLVERAELVPLSVSQSIRSTGDLSLLGPHQARAPVAGLEPTTEVSTDLMADSLSIVPSTLLILRNMNTSLLNNQGALVAQWLMQLAPRAAEASLSQVEDHQHLSLRPS
ncbi:hypothetical protein PoB_002989300 [Plakobranchus ocellatus]|uniref:Uncharacterized protein n=1 Tax=Plakobranchus ocellatus TaxID=259542 RepID=A0AAV4A9S2_9GAST|nr:hypothetical protein PoB_002989300 [Plakobranchus ocellatus]